MKLASQAKFQAQAEFQMDDNVRIHYRCRDCCDAAMDINRKEAKKNDIAEFDIKDIILKRKSIYLGKTVQPKEIWSINNSGALYNIWLFKTYTIKDSG